MAAPQPSVGPDASRSDDDAIQAASLVALDGLEGLNVERGLAFFAGRAAPYRQALGVFARLYADGLRRAETAAAPDAAATETIVRELHGAGSACASIGATRLAETAHALLAAWRTGAARHADAELVAATAAFDADLAALARALAARLAAADRDAVDARASAQK